MTSVGSVSWVQVPLGEGWGPEYRDEVVWVDVVQFDRCWRLSGDYVGPGGAGSKHNGRYENVGRYIMTGYPLYMPRVCLEEEGIIAFTDGRHRVAWLRDHGVEALPIEVAPNEVPSIEQRFGTERRESVWKSED